MNKIKFIIFISIFITTTANSQLTKGNWLVGGNANFSSAKYSSNSAISYTLTNIQISPAIGYFLIDKLSVGLRPSYSYTKTTLGTSSPAFNTFSVGPFVRYYFLQAENRLNILSDVNYQYGIRKTSDNPSSSSNEFSVLAGPVVYFNSSVGMEFLIGYSFTKYGGDRDSKSNAVQVGIGLQVHLEKDNK